MQLYCICNNNSARTFTLQKIGCQTHHFYNISCHVFRPRLFIFTAFSMFSFHHQNILSYLSILFDLLLAVLDCVFQQNFVSKLYVRSSLNTTRLLLIFQHDRTISSRMFNCIMKLYKKRCCDGIYSIAVLHFWQTEDFLPQWKTTIDVTTVHDVQWKVYVTVCLLRKSNDCKCRCNELWSGYCTIMQTNLNPKQQKGSLNISRLAAQSFHNIYTFPRFINQVKYIKVRV